MRNIFIVILALILANLGYGFRQHRFQPAINASFVNEQGGKYKEYRKKLKKASLELNYYANKYRKCNGIDLEALNILEVQRLFSNKKLNTLELVDCYLLRIKTMNVYLKAVLQVDEQEVRKLAKKLDEERKDKGPRSLLHGIPILIKDNLVVNSDNLSLRSSSGSLALLHTKNKKESEVVTKLREKGAIILGLANMSEFSGFRSKVATGGWSGRGGQTHSPYILSASASGSSTGSAVAVAANFALLAIGTETDGSITAPASRSAVVGLKPTIGSIPTNGLIPLSKSQDTIGPFAKCVTDIALVFNVLTQNTDLGLNVSHISIPNQLQVGVLRKPYWESKYVKNQLPHLKNMLERIKQVGFKVTDPVIGDSQLFDKISKVDEEICFRFEMKHYLNEYLSKVDHDVGHPKVKSLADIIQFNLNHPTEELSVYDQQYLIESQSTSSILNTTYLTMKGNNFRAATNYLDNLFKRYELDVIAVPAEYFVSAFTPPAIAGYPVLTVPLGLDKDGLPFGLALIAKPNKETDLIRLGYQLVDSNKQTRFKPKFIECCSFDELPPIF